MKSNSIRFCVEKFGRRFTEQQTHLSNIINSLNIYLLLVSEDKQPREAAPRRNDYSSQQSPEVEAMNATIIKLKNQIEELEQTEKQRHNQILRYEKLIAQNASDPADFQNERAAPPISKEEEEITNEEVEEEKAKALCSRGDCSYDGHGVPQSYERALSYYKEAIKLNSQRACSCVGKMYEQGIGVVQSLVEAIKYYKLGAERSDGASLFALGKFYEKKIIPPEGKLTPMEEAMIYYEKAAGANNSDAMTKLGYIYESVPGKQAESLNYYRKAADLQNALAINFLGVDLFRKQNYVQAVEMFKKSNKLGCARGSNNLGICFEEGIGVEPDLEQAMICYQDAAEKKLAPAMVNLGYLYLRKAKPLKSIEFYEKAAFWFRASLIEEPELSDSMFYLGFMFEKGLGVDCDMNEAFSYYYKASSRQHARATKKCGDLLYSGYGLLKADKNETMAFYKKAIEYGDPEAENAIGLLYEKGYQDLEKDTAKAFECYKNSYTKGCIEAGINMALLLINGAEGVPANPERGRKLMVEAAAKGDNRAKEYLIANKIVPTSPLPAIKSSPAKDEIFGQYSEIAPPHLIEPKKELVPDRLLSPYGRSFTQPIGNNIIKTPGKEKSAQKKTEEKSAGIGKVEEEKPHVLEENDLDVQSPSVEVEKVGADPTINIVH